MQYFLRQPGELIGMNIGPDEIHIMKRSEV